MRNIYNPRDPDEPRVEYQINCPCSFCRGHFRDKGTDLEKRQREILFSEISRVNEGVTAMQRMIGADRITVSTPRDELWGGVVGTTFSFPRDEMTPPYRIDFEYLRSSLFGQSLLKTLMKKEPKDLCDIFSDLD